MSKLSRGLFLGLFLISGLLYGRDANFYVHISLIHAKSGWQETSDRIGTPILRSGRSTEYAKFYQFYVREDSSSVELFVPDESWEIDAKGLDRSAFLKHRDNHTLLKFEGLPNFDDYEDKGKARNLRSKFITDSFIVFFDKLVELHPTADFGMQFKGHGGGGGELMGVRIWPNDAFYMLKEWNRSLGRKLLTIDMSHPCNKGSFSDLANFAPFTEYYLATDLSQGGYRMDDWTIEKTREVLPATWDVWKPDISYIERASGILDRRRKLWEYSINNMAKDGFMESLSLFDCEKFIEFSDVFQSVWETDEPRGTTDIKRYIMDEVENNERLLQLYNDCIIRSVNNKDFFEWPEDSNGMYKIHSWCKTYSVSIDEQIEGGVVETFPRASVFRDGSVIDLIATPAEGYVFEGWTGDVEGWTTPGTFKVDADTFISASFALASEPIVEEPVDDRESYHGEPIDPGNVEEPELRAPITEEPVFEGSKSAQYPNYFRWGVRTAYGNKWYHADWFGDFYNDGRSPWLYHTELGWLFRSGVEYDSIWFWDNKLGWLWTSREVYPYFHSTSRNGWIAYKKGTKNPRLFYDFKTQSWETH